MHYLQQKFYYFIQNFCFFNFAFLHKNFAFLHEFFITPKNLFFLHQILKLRKQFFGKNWYKKGKALSDDKPSFTITSKDTT